MWIRFGAAILVVLILVGVALSVYYQPTAERQNRGEFEPPDQVLGWRRSVAMLVLAPITAVVLPFFLIRERLKGRSR